MIQRLCWKEIQGTNPTASRKYGRVAWRSLLSGNVRVLRTAPGTQLQVTKSSTTLHSRQDRDFASPSFQNARPMKRTLSLKAWVLE